MPVQDIYSGSALARPMSIADFDQQRMGLDQHRMALQQNALALQGSQQAMSDQNALRTAAQGFGSDTGANYNAILKTGNVKAAQDYQKAMLNAQKTGADINLSQAHAKNFDAKTAGEITDNHIKNAEYLGRTVPMDGDPVKVLKWYSDGAAKGMISPELLSATLASIPWGDKAKMVEWAQGQKDQSVPTVEKMKLEQASRLAADQNATHLKAAGIAAGASRANNGDNIRKDYALAGMNPDGTPMAGGGGLLTPEAKINAASRYQIDGTLPPNIGRGQQGVRQTAEILNEAARQAGARGDTPEAQRIAQLANKSSAQALSKLSGQEAIVGAAEKNFTANANMVSDLSKKVDRTGAPLVNKWLNAGKRSITGDPDISALDANIKATVNEYAKIVGGGTGGGATAQGEIGKIESLLSAAQTPQQIEAVLGVMRKETANRMQSFKDQKAELTGSMIPSKPASGQTFRFDARGNPVK